MQFRNLFSKAAFTSNPMLRRKQRWMVWQAAAVWRGLRWPKSWARLNCRPVQSQPGRTRLQPESHQMVKLYHRGSLENEQEMEHWIWAATLSDIIESWVCMFLNVLHCTISLIKANNKQIYTPTPSCQCQTWKQTQKCPAEVIYTLHQFPHLKGD